MKISKRVSKRNKTKAEVRRMFDYDAKTGRLYRIRSSKYKYKKPRLAGRLRRDGYIFIGVDYHTTLASRLVWTWHYGKIKDPTLVIDHINGIRCDDRIENLRLVTQSENLQNRSVHRLGRPVGVKPSRSPGRWVAVRPVNYLGKQFGKPKHIGTFNSQEEAAEAIRKACL